MQDLRPLAKWTIHICVVVSLWAVQPALGQQKPPALPEGPGKEQVATLCSGCHGLGRVMSSGYPQAHWNTVIRMMINFGVPIPADQMNLITDYLAANLPEKPKPDAVILPGPAKVVIREWQVPIPGSRPHDPLATRDGAIWYTGQMTNRLGRVDPKTGQVREYPLKSPATGPHGLVEDRDGNIFYTGNHQALIGKLDPRTGNITEYKMTDPNAKDPHSLSFAQDGMLFFTLQQSNMIGRLDPRTGELRLVTAPTPRSRPYGILVDSKSVPHVVLFGTNKIARIDPKTMEIRDIRVPDPLRACAAWPTTATISSTTPTTRAARSAGSIRKPARWSSGPRPAGPSPSPTASSSRRARSGTASPARARIPSFASIPKTEKFQSWAIPSGGYIVRKMDVTPDGNPVIATSTVNGVGMVEVK